MKKLFSKFGRKKSSRDPSPANSSIHGSRGSINLIGVNFGYEINEKDLGKLHKAIWKNDIAKVKTLVKRDVGSLDKENRTPLHLASAIGNISAAEILLEYNAKVNVADNDQKTPLIKAIEGSHTECVELLLSYRAEVEICDRFGDKPVHHAAKKNDARIFKLLMDAGAKIDEKNKEGMAPIHIAVDNKDADFMTFLLNNGANIDTFDGECRTALMLAGKLDLQDIVRLLLENEADSTLVDNKGWSAEDHAMMAGHNDCVRMIRRAQSHRGSSSQRSRASSSRKKVNGHGDESDTEKLDSSNGKNVNARGDGEFSGARVLGIDTNTKAIGRGRRTSKSTDSDNSWMSDEESLPSGRKEKEKPRLNLQKVLNDSEASASANVKKEQNYPVFDEPPRPEERIEIILHADNHFEEVSVGDEGRSRVTKIPKIRDTRQRSRSSEKREPLPPTSARSEVSELGLEDSWQSDSESSSLPYLPKMKDIANGAGVNVKLDPVKESSAQGSPQMSKPPDKANDGEVLIMAASRRGESDDEEDSEWDSTVNDSLPGIKLKSSGGQVKSVSPRTGFAFLDPDDDEEDEDEDEEEKEKDTKIEKKPENTFGTSIKLGANAAWDTTPVETPRPLLSARESDWDSTIPDTTPRDGNALRDFDWDSSHPDVTPRVAKKESDSESSSVASEEMKPVTMAQKTVDSDWDSDSLSASIKSPRDFHNQLVETSKAAPIVEMNESDHDNQLSAIEEESLGRPTSESEKEHSPKTGLQKAIPTDKSSTTATTTTTTTTTSSETTESETDSSETETSTDSDWDSSVSEASPRADLEETGETVVLSMQPRLSATCPMPDVGGDVGTSEEEEEEEEESEWEIERKTARALAEEERKFAASMDGLHQLEQERYAERIENETENKLAEEERLQDAVKERIQDLHDDDRTPTASPVLETLVEPAVGATVSTMPKDNEDKQSLERNESASATGFNASHRKGKHNVRESQSGYDSDSSINETDPGRGVNITNDPSLTSPTGAYIHGVLGGPDHPDLVQARRAAELGEEEEEEDGLSYTSTEVEPGMTNVVNELSEVRRQLDREREQRAEAESRMRLLEADKKEFEARSEELERERVKLETAQAELEARVQSAKFLLAEEEERRQNTERLLEKTKQQLKSKEELYFEEQKEKQRAELDLRNLQIELSDTSDNIKKLESERGSLERALQQEKQIRLANEEISKEQMRVQQAMQEKMESEVPLTSRSLEGSPLRRFKKTESMENLATELMTTKTELDRVRQRFKDERTKWVNDNEDLQERIDALSKDIKLNQEALEQASMQYTLQLNSLRSENNGLCSNMEKVKSEKRNMEEEMASLKNQIQALNSGVERTQSDQVEEWTQRLQIREKELQQLRETNRSLQDKMVNAETRITSVEKELKSTNTTLGERNNQLKVMRHELEQRRRECDELNEALKHEEEMNGRLRARLSDLEDSNTNMHQNLKALLHSFNNREDFAPGVYDRLSDIVNLLESNKPMTTDFVAASEVAHTATLRRSLNDMEWRARRLDNDLSDVREEKEAAVRKLSLVEAELASVQKAKTDVDFENSNLKLEVDGLRTRLSNGLMSSTERAPDGSSSAASVADAHLSALIDRIEKAEAHSTQKLPPSRPGSKQQQFSENGEDIIEPTRVTSASAMRREHEAELALHRERANDLEHRLKAAESEKVSHQNLVEELKMRIHDLSRKLQDEESSRTDLQSLLNERHNATGESSKSASRRRLYQLENDNNDLQRKLGQERTDATLKNEKLIQLARKLRTQEDKNSLLEEELEVIKNKLRSAKERFRKFDDRKSSVSHSADHDEAISDIRQQLELLRSRIPEERNKDRSDDISRDMTVIKSLEKAVSKLEKQKKKVEDDFYLYQMYVQTNFVDRGTLDSLQSQLESRAQSEVNAKLVEVNRYLDETTRQRERIDLMRTESEDRMRHEVEKIKKEKSDEMEKLRASNCDLTEERERLRNELRQIKEACDHERRVKDKLSDQLEKANDNAAAAQAQLSLEREHTRSMSAANLFLSNMPLGHPNYHSPSMMSLYSQPPMPAKPTAQSPSPYLSNGLRGTPTRFGGSQADLQNRLRSELDRSISKHMEAGDPTDTTYEAVKPAEFVNSSPLDTILNGSKDEDLSYLAYLKRKYLI